MRVSPILLAVFGIVAAAACNDNGKSPGTTEPAADQDPASDTVPASDTAPAKVEPPPPAAALPADTGTHSAKHVWSRRLGGPTRDAARGVAAGPHGVVALAGYTSGEVDFGSGATLQVPEGADEINAYVALLAPDGQTRWARAFGGKGDDVANAVTIDPDGNIIAVGTFAHSLAFDDGTLHSAGGDDIFVVKLAPDGRRLWARRIGGRDVDAAHYVATDHSGRIIITGVFRKKMPVGDTILESAGRADIFIAVLAPSGEPVWARRFGAEGTDWGRAAVADDAGFIAFAGEFSGAVDFGGGALASKGNRDLVVARFSADGTHVWSKRFGSEFNEVAIDVAVDPARNIVVTGSFDIAIDFGCGKLSSAGESDAFVVAFSPKGTCRFAHKLGDEREDIGAGVGTDRFGNIAATGWFWGTPTIGTHKLTNKGRKDIYVTLMSPDGDVLVAKSFGAKIDDTGRALDIDGDGNVIVAGTFRYTLSFGGEDLVFAHTEEQLLPFGDAFVVKLSN